MTALPRPLPHPAAGSGVTRRQFLAGAALSLAGLPLLAACSPRTVVSAFADPSPNEGLADLLALMRRAGGAPQATANAPADPAAALIRRQIPLVAGELTRQCGVDKEGHGPQDCTQAAEGTGQTEPTADAADSSAPRPGAKQVQDAMERLAADPQGAPGSAPAARDRSAQAHLMAGLYSGLAAVTEFPNKQRADQVTRDLQDAVSGAGGGKKSLAKELDRSLPGLLDRLHAAVWALGLALAQEDSPARAGIRDCADTLRVCRDAVAQVLDASQAAGGGGVPYRPPAGFAEGSRPAPTSGEQAVKYTGEDVDGIIAALRQEVWRSTSAPARRFYTVWAGRLAQPLSQLDAPLGLKTQEITLRGEQPSGQAAPKTP
ncbi:hypothetical protein [Corynebacterium heidelbergense]|uniref:hypothetical protein n=1 Tax=Corynebacterium heidelbergense TaxID=2055947 RepID=UPI0011BEE5FE|nr:hypothetical protein [Corynebacterium heidelbergense]WCZ36724.1 hypothetical protein CHEID_05935 [Corynebacterium heidelbergense]